MKKLHTQYANYFTLKENRMIFVDAAPSGAPETEPPPPPMPEESGELGEAAEAEDSADEAAAETNPVLEKLQQVGPFINKAREQFIQPIKDHIRPVVGVLFGPAGGVAIDSANKFADTIQNNSILSEKNTQIKDEKSRVIREIRDMYEGEMIDGKDIDTLSNDALFTVNNTEELKMAELHLRELKKINEATPEWGVLSQNGILDSHGNPFIYKLEGTRLLAYAPGDLQELDFATLEWKSISDDGISSAADAAHKEKVGEVGDLTQIRKNSEVEKKLLRNTETISPSELAQGSELIFALIGLVGKSPSEVTNSLGVLAKKNPEELRVLLKVQFVPESAKTSFEPEEFSKLMKNAELITSTDQNQRLTALEAMYKLMTAMPKKPVEAKAVIEAGVEPSSSEGEPINVLVTPENSIPTDES